jgi:hypothetical protein
MHRVILIGLIAFTLEVCCSNAPFRNLLNQGLKDLKELIRVETAINKNKQLNKARIVLVLLIEVFKDLNWPEVVRDIKVNLNFKRHEEVQYAWKKLCMFSGLRRYEESEFFISEDGSGYSYLQAWSAMEAIISGGGVLSEWELLEAVKFLDNLLMILEKDSARFRDEVEELIVGVRIGLQKICTILEKLLPEQIKIN